LPRRDPDIPRARHEIVPQAAPGGPASEHEEPKGLLRRPLLGAAADDPLLEQEPIERWDAIEQLVDD
jgi:hypothetical protein